MERVFRTTDVQPRDRFAYWREAICDAYVHLGCDTGRRGDFSGAIRLNRLHNVALSFVAGDRQHVRRRARDIGRDSQQYFLLSVQRRGIAGWSKTNAKQC
jgi:hypothetical protein